MLFFCILEAMNNEEIQKLAELSRLTLSESERDSYKKDFEGILKYIDTIKNVEVEGKEHMNPSFVTKNIMRDDSNPYPAGAFTEELLDAAPRTEGNYIKVNKVL